MMFGGAPNFPQPPTFGSGTAYRTQHSHSHTEDYFNETVPFRCSMLGFAQGTRVRVVGLPFHHAQGHHHHVGEKRFEVNLVGQDDEKFIHVNPRKNEGAVVLNSTRSSQCWQAEERVSRQPFHHDEVFTLDLIAENDATRINVNGVHVANFYHRSDPNWVRYVEVAGDVKLHNVSVTRP